MKPIIELQDIYFRYTEDQDWTLKGMDFSLHAGEWVTILGGNGSGKSTFAKLLNGLLIPNRGLIRLFGTTPKTEEEIWHVRQKVGMIFQNPENQIVAMTVEDDVAFGLENIGVHPDEMEERIEQALQELGIAEYRTVEPHKLSGGQKQRLAIAGVLAMRPQVMIFDESTSMLDPQGAEEVIQIMHRLKQQGISIVHITHEMNEVYWSDRALLFHEGKILAEGNPRDLLSNIERLQEARLLPPFVVRVRDALLREGMNIHNDVITEEELVEEIWRLRLQM